MEFPGQMQHNCSGQYIFVSSYILNEILVYDWVLNITVWLEENGALYHFFSKPLCWDYTNDLENDCLDWLVLCCVWQSLFSLIFHQIHHMIINHIYFNAYFVGVRVRVMVESFSIFNNMELCWIICVGSRGHDWNLRTLKAQPIIHSQFGDGGGGGWINKTHLIYTWCFNRLCLTLIRRFNGWKIQNVRQYIIYYNSLN